MEPEVDLTNQEPIEPVVEPVEPVVETPPLYSDEELEALHPTAIDLDRVAPEAKPIVERTIKEYKSLQADYTRKSQELSKLKETVPEDKYFEDQTKNSVFKDYLKTPTKVLGDINAEIARLETVVPDDGIEEYRNARKTIAQWQAIKDEFREKRMEVSERTRQEELADAKMTAELGVDASALIEYAKGLGFSERDFKGKPELRAALRKTYEVVNAGKTAELKQRKSLPHKAAPTSGGGAGLAGEDADIFDPKMSTEERIARFRKNRAA